MSKRTKESKKRINSLVLLIAFTAILLIASTYAWFSTQKNVLLSSLKGQVEVAEGLQISMDAATWSQVVDLSDVTTATAEFLAGDGLSDNYAPTYMMPVSTTGETIQAAVGGTSPSRLEFFKGDLSGTTLKKISKTGQEPATTGTTQDYFAFDIYLMNTTKDKGTATAVDRYHESDGGSGFVQVDPLQLAFNSTVVNDTNATYAGHRTSEDFGLQNGVRVAFALYDGEKSASASDSEVINSTKNASITKVAIWEPNCDTHAQNALIRSKELRDAVNNETVNKTITTYALKDTSPTTDNAITAYTSIADTAVAVNNITQTSGNLTASGTVNGDEVTGGSTTGTVDLLNVRAASTATNADKTFNLKSNTISRVRVYVWLEGQDVDCINWATQNSAFIMNATLCKDATTKDFNPNSEANPGFTVN